MIAIDAGRFTVAVFQDVAWAQKGLNALKQAGFPAESLTVLAKESVEVASLIEASCGAAPDRIEALALGPVLAHGPMIKVLDGGVHELKTLGLSGTMRKVGFQPHDARIFDTLTGRGGVLVAIHSEPLAAEALAILHSYGGGNAAIGAWTGRV